MDYVNILIRKAALLVKSGAVSPEVAVSLAARESIQAVTDARNNDPHSVYARFVGTYEDAIADFTAATVDDSPTRRYILSKI